MASLTCIDGSAAIRSSVASAWRPDDYLTIMGHVRATDASPDTDFQRVFDRFYVVRRNPVWRSDYYSILEREKDNGPPDKRLKPRGHSCAKG